MSGDNTTTTTQTQGKMTGYTSTTLTGVTTGAGVAFANYDLATDVYGSTTTEAKKIGATSGGVSVKIEYPDAWDREIDGLPTNTKGLHECELCKPTLTMTLIEVNKENTLKYALGAATSATATNPSNYKVISPDPAIESTDYLNNITILTQTKGNPLIIVIENPISTEGFEFKTESKAGGGIDVTFTGNFDPTNLANAPIKFYVPTA